MTTQHHKVGDFIEMNIIEVTFTNRKRAFYWIVVPDGMTDEEAWNTQQRHGPFKTYTEADENFRNMMLGDVPVVDAGMWDPAWDKLQ